MTYIFITLTLDEVKRSFQINHRKHLYTLNTDLGDAEH